MSNMEIMEMNGDGEKGVGNTENQPLKRGNQAIYWFFTWNNYEMEMVETLETLLRHECKWFIMQEEIGANGTPHIQGNLCLEQRKRLNQMKQFSHEIHWEITKSCVAANLYCSKYETRNGKQWIYGIELPRALKVIEPYGWQLDIMEEIKREPDDRTIHWYWEPNGKVGKTSLFKYLIHKHNALVMQGNAKDVYYYLSQNKTKANIIIMNIPRYQLEWVNYGMIENLKDGVIISGKYESCQFIINNPHIFIFANKPPESDMMSKDRWNVVQIDVTKHIIPLIKSPINTYNSEQKIVRE